MDRSTDFYLLAQAYRVDEIGQFEPYFMRRRVMGRERSVSRAEWSAAGQYGLKPEKVLTMFGPDYQAEEIVQMVTRQATETRPEEIDTFSVYRTYRKTGDEVELYLERKVGDASGTEVIPGVRLVVDSSGRYLQDAEGRALLIVDYGS